MRRRAAGAATGGPARCWGLSAAWAVAIATLPLVIVGSAFDPEPRYARQGGYYGDDYPPPPPPRGYYGRGYYDRGYYGDDYGYGRR